MGKKIILIIILLLNFYTIKVYAENIDTMKAEANASSLQNTVEKNTPPFIKKLTHNTLSLFERVRIQTLNLIIIRSQKISLDTINSNQIENNDNLDENKITLKNEDIPKLETKKNLRQFELILLKIAKNFLEIKTAYYLFLVLILLLTIRMIGRLIFG